MDIIHCLIVSLTNDLLIFSTRYAKALRLVCGASPHARCQYFSHKITGDAVAGKETDTNVESSKDNRSQTENIGWWDAIFSKYKQRSSSDTMKTSQSEFLSDPNNVFELQKHVIKPKHMTDYLAIYEEFCSHLQKVDSNAKLIASWTVEVGEQDTAVHLWQYPGGYPAYSSHSEFYRTNPAFDNFRRQRNEFLSCRSNQILLPFNFWPSLDPSTSTGTHIYELRSYTLKPGTMIEWGNHWVRGIRFRMNEQEAFAGLFSHIGNIHQVHHIWKYRDLEHRSKMRDNAWRVPGWDECVLYTVPLIQHMETSILVPTPFSPHQ